MKNKMPGEHPENNLPESLPEPAQRAFAGIGITRLEQLTEKTESEILDLHGVGPKSIELLRHALAQRGLSFKQE